MARRKNEAKNSAKAVLIIVDEQFKLIFNTILASAILMLRPLTISRADNTLYTKVRIQPYNTLIAQRLNAHAKKS